MQKRITQYLTHVQLGCLEAYRVVLPLVGSGEEDVVKPEGGVDQWDLNPGLTCGS